jgi:hypothetical protein
MRTTTSRSPGLRYAVKIPQKPTVLSLLRHIIKSVFAGEVLWIAAPGAALLAYLYVNRFAADNLMALLIGAVAVLAFLRGCKEWQKELNDYHKTLSDNLRNRNTT